MGARLDLLVQWEIDAIDRFAREGYDYFTRRASETSDVDGWMTSDGRLVDGQELLSCRRLILETAVQQLNNVVDWTLLALAGRAAGDPVPSEIAKRQWAPRATLEREIQTKIGRPLRFVQGWSGVQQLRGEVNALKHRGGMTLHYQEDKGFNISTAVRLTESQVVQYSRATREWLFAAIRAVEETDTTT